MNDQELVQEALGKEQLASGRPSSTLLVDRKVVLVTCIDLDEPDAAALELELLDAPDHHFGISAVAAVGTSESALAHRRHAPRGWPIESEVGSPASGTTT